MRTRPLNLFACARRSGEGWIAELTLAAPRDEPWTFLPATDDAPHFKWVQDRWVATWPVDPDRWATRKPIEFHLHRLGRMVPVSLQIPVHDPGATLVSLPTTSPLDAATQSRLASLRMLPLVVGAVSLLKAFRHPSPPGMEWVYGAFGSVGLIAGLLALWIHARSQTA